MPQRRATVPREPAESAARDLFGPAEPAGPPAGASAASTVGPRATESHAAGDRVPGDRVAVLLPLPLGGTYDYAVPGDLPLAPGDWVRVPLGQREANGVVWDAVGDPDAVPRRRLRPVLERYDLPPMPALHRRFLDWVAAYTLSSPGAVLRMTLGSGRGLEPPKPLAAVRLPFDLEAAESRAAATGLRLTPARRRVLAEAAGAPARPAGELARAAGVGNAVVKGLVAGGLLEPVELPAGPALELPDWKRPGPRLTADQAAAAEALRAAVREAAGAGEAGVGGVGGAFSVSLLDGVTGAGKTEVYSEAIAAALAAGRQVLVLLPEIALTGQWLDRFAARFGAPPALWHSDLGSKLRQRTWRAVAFGEARVVVGARSALFLPFAELGLIVVDEEHEAAFKQEDGVTYHARDMAVVRAQLGGIPAVLASATPSLESLMNVRGGRYARLALPERHGAAGLPEIELVDLRRQPPPRVEGLGQSWLSEPLRRRLGEAFAAGEQAMLFLNRRGYAPLTLCRSCGHRLHCPNCTAWLVEHRLAGQLLCHHCGYQARLPEHCPSCGSEGPMAACGPGVERLGEEVRALFPEARTLLVSSDSVTGPEAAAELLRSVAAGEVDLLIGTQIVAKGHHFPKLTCVGVVDADLGLAGGDLRAAERTYQLLHQVAGRSGRADHRGRVLLQTYDPDHPVMQALVSGERDRFLESEAEARRAAGMPPYSRLVALILSSPDEDQVDEICAALARRAPRQEGVDVLGPAPAPLRVLRRRHRRRFLLRCRRDIAPQPIVRAWLEGLKLPGQARLQVDVDPYSFL